MAGLDSAAESRELAATQHALFDFEDLELQGDSASCETRAAKRHAWFDFEELEEEMHLHEAAAPPIPSHMAGVTQNSQDSSDSQQPHSWAMLDTFLPGLCSARQRDLQRVSRDLSRAFTVFDSIQRLGVLDRCTDGALNIHILGAVAAREGMLPESSAEVFSPLCSLLSGTTCRHLNLLLCGPDHGAATESSQPTLVPTAKCAASLHVQHAPWYYHDLLQGVGSLGAPHLAVAFNAGIWASSFTWEPSLQLLRRSRCPLVVTSYCEQEALQDEAALESMGANWLWEPQLNLWRSLAVEQNAMCPAWQLWENCWSQCVT